MKGDSLKKVKVLLAIHRDEFICVPAFIPPVDGDKWGWKAFNKILGKRSQFTYLYKAGDEKFLVHVDDEDIGGVTNSSLYLRKKRKL